VSLHKLWNVLRDLACIKVIVSIGVNVRFRSEICKLHMREFGIVPLVLQIAQIDKLRTKFVSLCNLQMCCAITAIWLWLRLGFDYHYSWGSVWLRFRS